MGFFYKFPLFRLFLTLGLISPVLGWSPFKTDIFKVAESVIDYALYDKKVSYKGLEDFHKEGEKIVRITLNQGQSIRYECGTKKSRESGAIVMYPSDPVNHSLDSIQTSGFRESVKRVLNHFDLYRSDRTLVYHALESIGGQYIIQYPTDTVITSLRHGDLSLNIACHYASGDFKDESLYRWLEVKFANVYPIPYGCGSVDRDLFINSIPSVVSGERKPISDHCLIDPKPDMVIGIYCKEDESIEPSDCFKHVHDKDGNVIDANGLYDPNFPLMDNRPKLRVFKVPETGYNRNVYFSCGCFKRNKRVHTLIVSKDKQFTCDYTALPRVGFSAYRYKTICSYSIHPGESFIMKFPTDSYLEKINLGAFKTILYPSNVFKETIKEANGVIPIEFTKNNEVFASTNFSIRKVTKPEGFSPEDVDEYHIDYKDDSILVLKSEITSLQYGWKMSETEKFGIAPFFHMILTLIPTDPYTYGCGANHLNIFRDERVSIEYTLDPQSATGTESFYVNCEVDASTMTPIGFYCPPDAVLEPFDCFESVIHKKTGKMVPLNELAPSARYIKTKNLNVIDFISFDSFSAIHDSDHKPESFFCNCKKKDGTMLAKITVINEHNGHASQTHRDEYAELISPKIN